MSDRRLELITNEAVKRTLIYITVSQIKMNCANIKFYAGHLKIVNHSFTNSGYSVYSMKHIAADDDGNESSKRTRKTMRIEEHS